MTEQEIETTEVEPVGDSSSLVEGLRRILLAGIGVAVLAQEEIEDFVTKLVDRGEIAENDGRSLVSDVLERRRQELQRRSRQAGSEVDRRLEGMLSRLNVPTQSEIKQLSEQIDALSKKVDKLRDDEE